MACPLCGGKGVPPGPRYDGTLTVLQDWRCSCGASGVMSERLPLGWTVALALTLTWPTVHEVLKAEDEARKQARKRRRAARLASALATQVTQ